MCKNVRKGLEPIKKSKISNFATENLSKKNKSNQTSKIQQAKGTRDIFGRLLSLAITKQTDVKKNICLTLSARASVVLSP